MEERILRVGVDSVLARCLATDYLRPGLVLDGDLPTLLAALHRDALDLVLSEAAPPEDALEDLHVARLASVHAFYHQGEAADLARHAVVLLIGAT